MKLEISSVREAHALKLKFNEQTNQNAALIIDKKLDFTKIAFLPFFASKSSHSKPKRGQSLDPK